MHNMATHHLLRLLQFVILLLHSAGDDSAVMLKLLSSLSPAPSGWSSATPCCTWPNVHCHSSAVVSINLNSAHIGGSLPPELNHLPNLQSLALQQNLLSGTLPSFQNMTSLRKIYLHNNKFNSVPENFLLGLTNLEIFTISENKNLSSWRIPPYLSGSTKLVAFRAANAGLTGGVPDLSNCTNLLDLQLRDNRITGVLPPSLMNLPKLVNVTLQNNRLQGPIPVFPKTVRVEIGETNSFCLDEPGPCDYQVSALLDVARAFGYPMIIADSWKGNNPCKDWIFITCDSLDLHVTVVNMPGQGLSGNISPAFSKLISLTHLELSDNSLSGVIPNVLTTLPQLQVLDISNNNFSGPCPIFPSKVKFNYSGNPLLTNVINNVSGSRDGSKPRGSHHLIRVIVGVGVALVFFIGIVIFISYKCHGKVKHKSDQIPVFEGRNVNFSFRLLKQATNDFDEEFILGRGGFGIVYRGELQDGTKIAVKRMQGGGMGTKGMNEFEAEITVLSKAKHRHLVRLLGYCINGNERLLVYEYMPQGTLGEHLFEWEKRGYEPLSWKQRVLIALDVATGLLYLHSLAPESCYIHRDMKTSNILLSDDMRAKVADFGLVKHVPDAKYSIETRVAGTFGYLAPEYAATGKVTVKVDVYAFGVVLMEIITGRKAVDQTMPAEWSPLVTWFRRVFIDEKSLRNWVDPTLNPDEETYESICVVAELASDCTAREPNDRPDMGHVVEVLGPFVEKWQPSEAEEEEEEEGDGIDLQISLRRALRKWQNG